MKTSQNTQQLIEIASWRLMTEFMRHLSSQYILIEYQPGMGYGNALAICERTSKHILLDYSRSGHFNIFPKGIQKPDYTNGHINEDVLRKDLTEILDHGVGYIGLSRTKKLPPSTPQVITYRLITTILSQSVFGRSLWQCKSGCLDSSVDGYAQRTELFKQFPEALKRTTVVKKMDFHENPNYNFWFILKDGKPICCLEIDGTMWADNGTKINIVAEYKKHRKLSSIMMKGIGHHLD